MLCEPWVLEPGDVMFVRNWKLFDKVICHLPKWREMASYLMQDDLQLTASQ